MGTRDTRLAIYGYELETSATPKGGKYGTVNIPKSNEINLLI